MNSPTLVVVFLLSIVISCFIDRCIAQQQDLATIQDIVVHPPVLRIGSQASLKCFVSSLEVGNNVIWMRVRDSRVLSLNDKNMADETNTNQDLKGKKYQIFVTRKHPNVENSGPSKNSWIYELKINNLLLTDDGEYKCKITATGYQSTEYRIAMVTVMVPPRINKESARPKYIVSEGNSVSMFCSAEGQPTPTISWTRVGANTGGIQDKKTFKDGSSIKHGNNITIENVDRSDDGMYRCSARNNVDPESFLDTQFDIRLSVRYTPQVFTQTKEIGQASDKNLNVDLDCMIKASPNGETAWFKVFNRSEVIAGVGGGEYIDVDNDGGEGEGSLALKGNCLRDWIPDYRVLNNDWYYLRQSPSILPSELFVKLSIKNVKGNHYGYYLCVSENELGQSCDHVELYLTRDCQGQDCSGGQASRLTGNATPRSSTISNSLLFSLLSTTTLILFTTLSSAS